MSTLDLDRLRKDASAWADKADGGFSALVRLMKEPRPTAEAVRLFAVGRTQRPAFASALADVVYGLSRPVGVAEEIHAALRMVREVEGALVRALGQVEAKPLPRGSDAQSIANADNLLTTPSARAGATKAARKRAGGEK